MSMYTRMRRPRLLYGFILLGTLLTGCGQDDPGPGVSPVQVVLLTAGPAERAGSSVQSIPEEVVRIDIAISGPDMGTLSEQKQVMARDRENGYVEALFSVPNGEDRMISVVALDAQGGIQWTGESNLFSVPTTEPVFVQMTRT